MFFLSYCVWSGVLCVITIVFFYCKMLWFSFSFFFLSCTIIWNWFWFSHSERFYDEGSWFDCHFPSVHMNCSFFCGWHWWYGVGEIGVVLFFFYFCRPFHSPPPHFLLSFFLNYAITSPRNSPLFYVWSFPENNDRSKLLLFVPLDLSPFRVAGAVNFFHVTGFIQSVGTKRWAFLEGLIFVCGCLSPPTPLLFFPKSLNLSFPCCRYPWACSHSRESVGIWHLFLYLHIISSLWCFSGNAEGMCLLWFCLRSLVILWFFEQDYMERFKLGGHHYFPDLETHD